jgi:hypothetical protein
MDLVESMFFHVIKIWLFDTNILMLLFYLEIDLIKVDNILITGCEITSQTEAE